MDELVPGLHRWTARHPDWHPTGFGDEVASFALESSEALLLVDPLLPDEAAGLLDELASRAERVHVFITIGYHVRSAEALSRRYDNAPIHGPETVRRRLADPKRYNKLAPEDGPGPAGVTAHAIGRPRRSEAPLHFPSHDALAFGDALVTTPQDELRMWCQDPDTEARRAFYRRRFGPTLRALVDLEPRAVLTTHGAPILDDATAALRTAITSDPWFHRG